MASSIDPELIANIVPETTEQNINYVPYIDVIHRDIAKLDEDYQEYIKLYKENNTNVLKIYETQIQQLNNQIEQLNTVIQGVGLIFGCFVIVIAVSFLRRIFSPIEQA